MLKPNTKITLVVFCILFFGCKCDRQIGPDPWHYDQASLLKNAQSDVNIPSDFSVTSKKVQSDKELVSGEWFFRRILAIMLKGGQVKNNEDDSIDVCLQMHIESEQWKTMNEYMQSKKTFSEEMFRRSVGYIEESIYTPTITEKIVMAWSDYIQSYVIQYKSEVTWLLSLLTGLCIIVWLWNHMSHKNVFFIIILIMYLYEVFISYKEAEKQELDRFITVIERCKWYIWSSTCDVPPPDPLIFFKHMNPLKIVIRMFTTIISEPMITLNDTLKIIIHGLTGGLWYPLDNIMYGILILTFNVLLLFLLIMIIFNFILNIPFSLSFLGLINVGLTQRNKAIFSETSNQNPTPRVENNDRISGATLNRLLDVCSRALSTAENHGTNVIQQKMSYTKSSGLRRSASAGRLYDLNTLTINNNFQPIKRLQNRILDGSGDAR